MHERIIGLYEENAAAWDRQRGRDLLEKAWLDRFLRLVPEGGEILDVGCGMGEPIAGYLAALGYKVTGLDASPSLIALCQSRFPDHEWLVADMRTLDLGSRFNGILAWHSLFHLSPDHQRPMFARFALHARASAPLLFTSGTSHGEAIGEWEGEPLYHGSLDPSEYRRLLKAAGFTVRDHRVQDPECGGATIWLAQMSPASGLDGSA